MLYAAVADDASFIPRRANTESESDTALAAFMIAAARYFLTLGELAALKDADVHALEEMGLKPSWLGKLLDGAPTN